MSVLPPANLQDSPTQRPPAPVVDGALAFNVFSLYVLQGCNYIFPLITIPYLARVLKPTGWGLVAFSQGFAYLVQVAIDFGFVVSGPRLVAQNRDSVESRAVIVSGVLASKGLLALAMIAVTLLFQPWLPYLNSHPRLLWAALLCAAGQAFGMTWYFQGLERLGPALVAEVSANSISTLAILLLVRRPEDGWQVLAFQGAASLAASAVVCGWACRDLRLRFPRWPALRSLYRSAWPLFSYRAALTLYSQGNPFLLGLFAPPAAVGSFAGADRIARAFLALVNPLIQAIYPRVTYVRGWSAENAGRFSRMALLTAGLIGLISGAVVWSGAPVLVRLVLGANFQAATPTLQVLALLCPLISVNTVIAFVWLLPRNMDAPLTRLTLWAGVVNLGLAILLARPYSHLGMAWAVVLTEVFVLFGLALSVRFCRHRGYENNAVRTAVADVWRQTET
jgi:PST family polysaccharide transporter